MPPTQTPFDWRAFWADLLRGTGHAVLTLDDSHEARAAMAGLEHFHAAQRRRAEGMPPPATDQSGNSLVGYGAEDMGGNADSEYGGPGRPSVESGDGRYGPMGEHTRPRLRPIPLSANPYDLAELPIQVSFPARGLPVFRRR